MMSSSEFTIVWDIIHKVMFYRLVHEHHRGIKYHLYDAVLVTVTHLCVKSCTRLWYCVAAADKMWRLERLLNAL